jgi:hypothetical protein
MFPHFEFRKLASKITKKRESNANICMNFDDSNRKMIFRVSGSHSGGYEDCYLLRYKGL